MLVLLILLVSFMAACSSGGGSDKKTQASATPAQTQPGASAKPKDPVTLQWLVFENVGFTAEMYSNIIATFEKANPDIKIEKRLYQGDNRGKYLQTLVATDQVPDLINDGGPLAQMKMLLPIDDKIVKLVKDEDIIRYNDGKVYYVPTDEQIKMSIYYNKKIFADNGLAVPKNWDEFLKLCETLKAKGINPVVGGNTDRVWLAGALAQPMIMQEMYVANPNWQKEMLEGKIKWNNPVTVEALSRWKDFIDKGYYHPGSMQFSYAQHSEEFKKGNAAMIVNGGWYAGDLDTNNPNLDIGWFPIPMKQGGNYYEANIANNMAISAKTKYPEQAARFIEFFLSNKDIYSKWIQADAGFAVTKQPVEYEMKKTMKTIADGIKSLKPIIEWDENKGDLSMPIGFGSYYQKSLQEMFTAKKEDFPKFLDKWDAEMQKLLQAQKQAAQ